MSNYTEFYNYQQYHQMRNENISKYINSRSMHTNFLIYFTALCIPLFSILMIFTYLSGLIKRKKAIMKYRSIHSNNLSMSKIYKKYNSCNY